ncbi:MAG: hypothetical protein DHS20C05_22410 [Hyphococcus sp.]|nr:MAG: hypothetical protein DHS20C05_22410 [Marinicaulis sp.]
MVNVSDDGDIAEGNGALRHGARRALFLPNKQGLGANSVQSPAFYRIDVAKRARWRNHDCRR